MRDIRAYWCSSPDKLCVNHAACNQKDSCIYLIAPQKLIKPKVKKKKKK